MNWRVLLLQISGDYELLDLMCLGWLDGREDPIGVDDGWIGEGIGLRGSRRGV